MVYERLQKALLDSAERAERERVYGDNRELMKANQAAVALFSSPKAIMRSMGPGERRVNISVRALRKADRFLLSHGVAWRMIDWDALLNWLYNNWDKVLRVLLSLLALVLM